MFKIKSFYKSHRSLILGIVICLMGMIPSNPQRFIHACTIGYIVALFFVCWEIGKMFGLAASLLAGWSLGNALFYFRYPNFYFSIFGPVAEAAFQGIVAESTLWLVLCIVLGILIVKNEYIGYLEKALHYLFWGEIFWMIVGRLSNDAMIGHRYLGILDNEAMDATFLLALSPIVIFSHHHRFVRTIYHLILVAMILLSKSSTALVGYGIMWGFYFLIQNKSKLYKKLIFATLAIALSFGVGVAYLGKKDLVDPTGRFGVWESSFNYWSREVPKWKGTGIGTFALYGPGIQLQGTRPGEVKMVFMWMHSDPLQILFELGWVGLALALLVYLTMLYKSRDRHWLTLSILILGAISLTQMPLRHAPSTVLVIYLVCATLGKYGRDKET